MKYEIINPSDPCFLEHPDRKTAIAACLVLSEGSYGLKDEKGETVCPIIRFGGAQEFLKETFGGVDEYSSFLAANYTPLADALESVSLPHERSSLNDIQARAKKIAAKLREREYTPTPSTSEEKKK